jgi:hypothetical protein
MMPQYLPPMFEGRRFATRRELHVYLAGRTGKTPQTCRLMLARLGGDPGAVIAHYRVAETTLATTNHTPVKIDFGDRTGADLHRYLAFHSGRPVNSCRDMLKRLGGDPQKVLDYFNARVIEVSGRRFPNLTAFFRDLQQRFLIAAKTANQWYYEQNLSLAAIEARAREIATRRRVRRQRAGAITVFGWRFGSFAAAIRYYRPGSPHKALYAAWRAHCRRALAPGAFFEPYALKLGDLLDARARLPPETEASLNPRWRPQNDKPLPVTDPTEKLLLSILQVRRRRRRTG